MKLYLGIDFGTSGVRAIGIDDAGEIQVQTACAFTPASKQDWAGEWRAVLFLLLEQISVSFRQRVQAIAINGTSSTVLFCDAVGQPLAAPILYNDDRGRDEVTALRAIAPADHTVLSATSSLVKLLWWQRQPAYSQTKYLFHQADWLAYLLHGQPGISDYHNSLKLGYDVGELRYPTWLENLEIAPLLPHVLAPGTPIGTLQPDIATRFELPATCVVCAGTTDSIAAFLASGATVPGEAVTSLGSTLVLKLLSQTRVDDAQYGIYSHRLGDRWLVGGASNTGGAVLRLFFTDSELTELSQRISPDQESPYNYYPLLKPGERFPVNDPNLAPRLDPQPRDRGAFLHGLLESMARIEAQGYHRLQALGATPLKTVYTAGGGATNPTWTAIRQRCLKVPTVRASHTEAAYGTALLAKQSVAFAL